MNKIEEIAQEYRKKYEFEQNRKNMEEIEFPMIRMGAHDGDGITVTFKVSKRDNIVVLVFEGCIGDHPSKITLSLREAKFLTQFLDDSLKELNFLRKDELKVDLK